ncbi:Putative colanic acid biosysnthesis UDP-glucose lipid carrier transferase [Tenacibaculum sp. 190524A02b]|uniref:exopolysaccharide biosynthesis polyprenyl glycosylphosphotransferase n=1 Tax=Tenacibaculum vairaonense TaxID=3137860 RepID=UPI0032B2D78C
MKKRYSKYINIAFLLVDLLIIYLVVFLVKDKEYLNLNFLGYISLFWVTSSLFTNFYKVFRFTTFLRIVNLLIRQFLIFALGFFTYFSIFREGVIVDNQFKTLLILFISISVSKILGVFILKKYRRLGNNYRKVIVLGNDSSAKKLIDLFKMNKELGYQYCGFFSDTKNNDKEYLGTLKKSFSYTLENEVDEIYCSLTEMVKGDLKKVKKFATKNNRIVKLIPNSNELYQKDTVAEYYGDATMILKVKKMPFELNENRIIKRIFDIIFSSLVCIFVMSWLYPLLFILIKLESKGPAIFKQKREGLHGGEFVCYKFRSMRLNDMADKVHASKNDSRVTKIGAFLRKTSLDEFPQFFNVFLGSMSVVGPRPHMNEQSSKFTKEVRNYMKRKEVKPGITGLAQISGYRGEIIKKSDIENRVRLDIFYIENWSLALDIKIVFQTFFNVFTGEEKAY